VIPVSALRGDNVTLPPRSAPGPLRGWAAWYHGPSLLELLERLPAVQEQADAALLIPVQYVARESARRDGSGIHLVHAAPDNDAGPIAPPGEQPRTLWGRIAQGRVQRGDAVQLFPSGEQAKVTEVRVAGRAVDAAQAGQSAGLVLDRQLDVSRGDWIAGPRALRETRRVHATLAWLDTEPAVVGRKYWVRHGSRWVQARIAAIESRLDIHTLAASAAQELAVNDIGHVIVETQQALPLEAFEASRVGGALIVVDPTSNRTSGALLVKEPA
jgi:sulfate adenylyltransferase subunit 1